MEDFETDFESIEDETRNIRKISSLTITKPKI